MITIDIEGVKQGSDKAWEQVFKKYWRSVVYFLHGTGSNEQGVLDAAQQAFIKAYNIREKLDTEKHLKNFLFKVARNEWVSICRRVVERDTVGISEDLIDFGDITTSNKAEEEALEHEMMLREVLTAILQCICQLSQKDQDALLHRLRLNSRHDEQQSNVYYVTVSRARQRLLKKAAPLLRNTDGYDFIKQYLK